MAAIVGAAGLPSTLAAASAGKRLLIANKEALVMAGRLVLGAAARSGATIIPIDSEHNAVFQCLPASTVLGTEPPGVRRVMLTASGGPFRTWSASAIQTATPEQACAHPTWNMGRKISVDSATLMNKGLELIEAQLLFGLPVERIEVVIHPQSVVHSLVEYIDGSVLAQLGSPDNAHSPSPGPRVAAAAGLRCTIPRLAEGCAAGFRAPGPAALPLPGTGHRRGARGRGNACRAQRRQ